MYPFAAVNLPLIVSPQDNAPLQRLGGPSADPTDRQVASIVFGQPGAGFKQIDRFGREFPMQGRLSSR